MENIHISESTGTQTAFPHTQHANEEDTCMKEKKSRFQVNRSVYVFHVCCMFVLLSFLTCSSWGLLFIHSGRVLSPITASFRPSLTIKHHKASTAHNNSSASMTV